MMYLISGQPGNGKTLRLMALLLSMWEDNDKAVKDGTAERRRFYTNVAGATLDENPEAFPWLEKLPDHNDWTQLPNGSVVAYDEAHSDGNTPGLERYGRLFPSTGKPGESEDMRIRSMSTHRHRGFDLIFVTQWPSKIHHQVRTLIGQHLHMNRAFGLQRAGVLTWTRVQPDPYDEKIRDKCEEEIWGYPKDLYPRYRSATLHTSSHKFKMPAKVWQALGTVVVLIVGFWALFAFVIDKPEPKTSDGDRAGVGALAGGVALAPLGAGSPPAAPLTVDEYIAQHVPRITAQPWSAPAYDERSVVAKPELYCMASGPDSDRSCTCLTEQGTKYRLQQTECERIALHGPSYNPYREQPAAREVQQHTQPLSMTATARNSQPAAIPGVVIGVQQRPMSTFPESAQNRYSGQ